MVDEPNSTPSPEDAPAAVSGLGGANDRDDPPSGVAALLRLAAVLVDEDGRIVQWNRAAEELFGHRAEVAHGRTASGLLPAVEPRSGSRADPHDTPYAEAPAGPRPERPPAGRRCDAFDTLDDLTQLDTPWAGAMTVTDREERLRDVFWWAYPLIEPAGRSLLALAADARPLRSAGPRIAIGERLLPYAATATAQGGFQRLAATFTPPGQGTADPLATLLPAGSPGRVQRLLAQLVRAGLPALSVDTATVLPVLPFEPPAAAGTARAAAGLGRRYPTAQQRASRLGPARPEQATGRRTDPGRPAAGRTGAAVGLRVLPPGAPGNAVPGQREATPSLAPDTAAATSEGDVTIEQAAVDPAANGQYRPDPAAAAIPAPGGAAQPDRIRPILTDGQAGEQLALLNEVGGKVGTTLDLDTTARELCQVLVPRVADFASVDLLDGLISDAELPATRPDDATMLRRVARTFNAAEGEWDHVLEEGALLAMPRSTPPGMALQLNQPVLVPVLSPDVAVGYAASLSGSAVGDAELVQVVAGRSMLVLPLSARGTVIGVLKLLRLPDRGPFDESDAATLKELAARAALSLDNARLHRAESRVATTLQRSMIPTRPPRIPGVQIAHRYLPGDPRAEVGGDWFDAIQLPGSRVALVVGDVMGHGLHSAAAMGRFRTAMQTLAALDLPPGQLLRHLDNLAHKLGDDHLATCLYAVYDPINRTCELASAGHVPPVLVHPDGTGELLEIPAGAPIGVGGVPFVAKKIDVQDGSMLVLCTDGLVEVRGSDIGAGLAALCGNLIDPKQTPEQACDVVLDRLHSDDRKDDVALLVARFDGVAPSEVATWDLAVDTAEVRRARALVREQLAAWHLEAIADTTELLVSELVTNAVRVARDTVRLQLIRVDKLLVEVSDDNHNLPSLEPAEELGETGRGLHLVTTLAERWGSARKAVGKVVWFELPLPRAPRD